MQHRPGCLIAWQSEKSLEPHRVDAHFLISHPPNRSIPQTQGDLTSMEDGSGRGRDVRVAVPTLDSAILGAPRFPRFTSGTDKSFGPTYSCQVVPA
jgi:hypothetical protein